MKLFALACATAAASVAAETATGTNWVVIAAGSKTYGNYRHQADACHAYQVARKGGVPADQIILMMEDDIANDQENPFPGKMFNKPTAKGVPGVDIYEGCNADYTGSVVTAKLFLDVITGNKAAVNGLGNGKVLESGPNDKVFINFADHGGTGIIEFPNGDFLHATDLNDGLKTMHTNDMYDKLVFYMEACESGSMFENLLPKDINIYATTAANAQESSWGTYCPPDDLVDGKPIFSCLGDLYSVNWMEDADTASGMAKTLEQEFKYIKKVTNKSHVMQYGTLKFEQTDTLGDYLAPNPTGSVEDKATAAAASTNANVKESSKVGTHDIELVQDFYKYLRAESLGKTDDQKKALGEALVSLIQTRQLADDRFAGLASVVSQFPSDFETTDDVIDADCVKKTYNAFRATCGAFDSYTLKYTHQVADLCTTHSDASIQSILTALCE